MSTALKNGTQLSPLKQALLALDEMQAKLDTVRRAKTEPIAVIGMGCRFPGNSDSPESFWQLLHDGVDAIREVPADRWDVGALYDPDSEAPGKSSTRWAGFLDRVDLFDPQFFNIAPREAVGMDPQQRLLLEVAWEALENACQSPDQLSGSRTGVFIGITNSDYSALQLKSGDPTRLDAYYASGIAHSIASGRLSYVLGLQGPSISLDTACSSSLVALHLAVQSLRNGECGMALAGGVNLILSPDNTISFSKSHMLAADGRCKTFDASADGFAEGEGCGIIVLKRLSDALAAGDCILAVVRGTAVNQDGASSGLTAPNGLSQQAVIREALANARVKPSEVGYVEAHGTGTSLGDPIEVQALGAVLSEGRHKDRPFMLGSVKTNIGHLEAAAGVAGFIKVVLALQHREIPPHLHFKTPNPFIPWGEIPAVVPTQCVPWAPDGVRRIAGLSSFGFSGTNAHIILEEAPAPAPNAKMLERPLHILTLSAKMPDALKQVAGRFATHVGNKPGESLPDICFSANAGRAHLPHRLSVVSGSRDDLLSKLAGFVQGHPDQMPDGVQTGEAAVDRPRVAWLFTGQGAQYVGMGRQLYDTQPVFQAALARCDELLHPHLGQSLLEVLFNGPAGRLDQTGYTQPALFALEYALAQLWLAWGVQPDVVMGHSVGEYVAACIAGVFSLEEGLRLIATRARLMQALPLDGAMATVFADQASVEQVLAPYAGCVSIAALNGPTHTVISGAATELQSALDVLGACGIKTRRLNVSHAFHSPLMEPMLGELEQAATEMRLSPPRLRLISNLTGGPAGQEITRPDYWHQHARQPVQFMASMQALQAQGVKALVEVGPQPVLLGMGQRCWPEGEGLWLPSLRQGRPDWQQMLESLTVLYVRGAHINWAGFDQGYSRRKLALPTYPFQRERFWFVSAMPKPEVPSRGSGTAVHPLLGQKLRSALKEVQFESQFSTSTFTFLDDHRVHDVAILPAAAYLEMGLAAGCIVLGAGQGVSGCANEPEPAFMAEDVVIHKALAAHDDEVITSQLIMKAEDAHTASFELFSQRVGEEEWTRHASGRVRTRTNASPRGAMVSLADIRARCQESVAPSAHYQMLGQRGFSFGPSLHGLIGIWRGEGEALGYVQLPEPQAREAAHYFIHPALLDACLQTVSAVVPAGEDAYLPVSLERFVVHRRPAHRLWSYISARTTCVGGLEPVSFTCDVILFDEAGEVVAEATGLGFARTSLATLQRAIRADATDAREGSSREAFTDWLYEVTWQRQALAIQPPTDAAGADGANVMVPHSLAGTRDLAVCVRQAAEPASLHRELADPAVENAVLDLYQQLDRLSTDFIVRAFRQLGWQPQPRETVSAPALIAQLGIAERHRKLTIRLLDILTEEGILQRRGEAWEVVAVPEDRRLSDEDAQMDWTTLGERYPAGRAELALLGRCGSHLAEVLRGDVDPLQLLFPDGSMTSAEQLYQESSLARLYNGLIREAVARALGPLSQGQRVRVLEIGAGTGGTTSFVLPVLPADRTQYVFSDISPHFTLRAQQKFKAYGFVQYRPLDIEDDPMAQGFTAQSFDIILAANVIHATADLQATLRRVRQLLTPGGLLILLEVIEPQRWIDLTFGLTEGWWKFIDHDIRPAYPLLSSQQWLRVLTEAGFTDGAAPLQQEEGGDLRAIFSKQSILLARAPSHQLDKPQERVGAWLVFADAEGVGSQLASALEARGEMCVLIRPGETYERLEQWQWQLNPAQPEHFGQLLREALLEVSDDTGGKRLACRGIIHLWSLPINTPADTLALRESQSVGCGSALHLTQAMLKAEWLGQRIPRLWLVTRNAQVVTGPATGPMDALVTGQATVWGLGNTIALEHPDLRCVRVDLGPSDTHVDDDDVEALLAEVRQTARGQEAQHVEDRVAFRQGRRYVARLSKMPPWQLTATDDAAPETQALRLEIPMRGALDSLVLQPIVRRQPGPGEVEIRVHATGLNFKDVLNTLGMYPGDPGLLGGECSGTVVALGEGVTGLRQGDEVVALAPGCFSTYVVAPAEFVVPKPPALTFVEAASAPIAFVTAYFALHHLGHIAKGDRVLIHAAAGGVGLAAVQFAQQAGAEIFATAGSAEKRAYLESLGVIHVMDSRSPAFADEIRLRTGGEGVDIVLNSLAGEFIPWSLSLLGENGRFLELGKRGLLSSEQVAGLGRNIAYHTIDWGETAKTNPNLIRSILMEVVSAVGCDALKPLPLQTFPVKRAVDAFRYMAQAKHTGKIVITQEAPGLPQSVRESGRGALALRPNATYLITGGLGGLGLHVANWMAERGARHLVLVGRSSPSERAHQRISALEQQGCQVVVMQSDVSQTDQVAAALSSIQQSMPPLRGVVCAAGVLDDGALLQQDWSRFARVMAPKVDGAWNLHTLTRHMPLDFFVLFSSAASILGAAGQSNHAAANAYLDALAHYRCTLGMPSLSINWGAWSEVGAAAVDGVSERIATLGAGTMTPEQGAQAMEYLLLRGVSQAAVLPMHWPQYARQFALGAIPGFLSEVTRGAEHIQAQPRIDSTWQRHLTEAAPAKRRNLLLAYVEEQVGKVLSLDPAKLRERSASAESVPLNEMGLDSLMAVELRNRLSSGLGLNRKLSATLVYDYPTIAAIADFLYHEVLALDDKAETVGQLPAEQTGAPQPVTELLSNGSDVTNVLESIEGLSDEEVDRLLMGKQGGEY